MPSLGQDERRRLADKQNHYVLLLAETDSDICDGRRALQETGMVGPEVLYAKLGGPAYTAFADLIEINRDSTRIPSISTGLPR